MLQQRKCFPPCPQQMQIGRQGRHDLRRIAQCRIHGKAAHPGPGVTHSGQRVQQLGQAGAAAHGVFQPVVQSLGNAPHCGKRFRSCTGRPQQSQLTPARSGMIRIHSVDFRFFVQLQCFFRHAPAARSFARYPRSMQLLFGVVPLAGYLFDYVTRIYTDLLAQGNQAAVEFMPFVCSVAYIVFVLRVSAEERTRGQLEQTRNNLKLQVGQAVREIEALRTSQQQTRAYRHDLRHHLQYISACIENGRGEQAQEYIQSICSEIEASKVTTYCENEAANLIFSSFAGRAESCGVPLNIQAHIPQLISVAETDLCVLLSNALENALRACRRMKAENGPAYIEVTAREKNGHLFLQFVNPCPEGIQFENGLPVTHAEGHGIGVRSICAIVEKYKGLSDFSVQDGRFILRVSL